MQPLSCSPLLLFLGCGQLFGDPAGKLLDVAQIISAKSKAMCGGKNAHIKRPITKRSKHKTAQKNNPRTNRPKLKTIQGAKRPKLLTVHGTKRPITLKFPDVYQDSKCTVYQYCILWYCSSKNQFIIISQLYYINTIIKHIPHHGIPEIDSCRLPYV
jgi:hypothetical protein